MEIRRSYDRLISTMGFPILVRWHLYIESGPWWLLYVLVILVNICSDNGLILPPWHQANVWTKTLNYTLPNKLKGNWNHIQTSLSRKCCWKCFLQAVSHFVLVSCWKDIHLSLNNYHRSIIKIYIYIYIYWLGVVCLHTLAVLLE